MRHPLNPIRGLTDARRVLTGTGWTVEAGTRRGWHLVTAPGQGQPAMAMPQLALIRLAERVKAGEA